MKNKKPIVKISGDTKPKSMILSLDPEKHAWVKDIADRTGIAQPKIVNLVLSRAAAKSSDEYVDEINKLNASEKLKEREKERDSIDSEIKRLKEQLES